MKRINFNIEQLRVINEICKKEIKDKAIDFIKKNYGKLSDRIGMELRETDIEDFAELMTDFVIDEL